MTKRKQNGNLIHKIFYDSNGKVVIFQTPNIPIIIAAVAWVFAYFIHQQPFHMALSILFYIGLTVWAVMEIGRGVNFFRRGLGLIVLLYIIGSLAIMLFRNV